MLNKRTIFITAVVLVFLASGCAKREDVKVLARVGDKVISLEEFKARVDKLPAYYQTIVSRNKKKFLDDLIAEELFYDEAVREGLHRDKETQEVIQEAKKKIIIAKLIKKEVEDKIRIADEELRKYYDEHKDEFKTPEMWRASHILVMTEPEAKEILEGLNSKGLNFEETAKSRSQDATAQRGGDIGYFTRGQLVPEFEEACVKLNVGDPCQIVKTQFGYHIIKLTDKKSARVEDFDKVRSPIEDRLKRNRRKELFNKLVAGLKEKYRVSVEEDALQALEKEPRHPAPSEGAQGDQGGRGAEGEKTSEAGR